MGQIALGGRDLGVGGHDFEEIASASQRGIDFAARHIEIAILKVHLGGKRQNARIIGACARAAAIAEAPARSFGEKREGSQPLRGGVCSLSQIGKRAVGQAALQIRFRDKLLHIRRGMGRPGQLVERTGRRFTVPRASALWA
jgi:hypothetical protein